MATESLQAAIDKVGDPVEFMRNVTARAFTFPVQPEFTNWRSEQHSWLDTCALLDQSHHMCDLFISGPDATKLLTYIATNSAATYTVNRAKHLVAVNHDGYVIGDAILFHMGENEFNLVGVSVLIDWIQFNAETGNWDVKLERDDNSVVRAKGDPKLFRYELQGPNALKIFEKVTGKPAPELKFFHMGEAEIAGVKVGLLRHGMAGQPGYEIFGDYKDGEKVRAKLLEDGAEFGIVPCGAKAYSSSNLANGWVPTPPPAIFEPELKAFREWQPATRSGSFGGSFYGKKPSDYYVTPWEIGLERSVSFDHDFIGKEALQKLAEQPQRTRVTLVWNADDVAAAVGTLFDHENVPAKYIEFPKSRYAYYQTDEVLVDGKQIGMSLDVGYLASEQAFLSLATIDPKYAETGTEVTVVWGENPRSGKAIVEDHRQVTIRAKVAPAPFHDYARAGYRDWA